MDQKGKDLLNLMFKKGEEVCVSPNKWGYHSVSLEKAMGDRVTLVSTRYRDDGASIEESLEHCLGENLQLVALNPIRGWRMDSFVTAYRSFLIEMDEGSLAGQRTRIKATGMPYSAIVYSGGKSLHFLVTLEEDLIDKNTYDFIVQWILNIMSMADQNTKNPSRSIRIPGANRDGKKQKLVEIHGKVPNKDLHDWLNLHPDKKPKTVERKPRVPGTATFDMKPWMAKVLNEGQSLEKGRNVQWFSIAVELFLHGYDENDVIDLLEGYFVEERDFKRKEWLASIKSAGKYVSEKK